MSKKKDPTVPHFEDALKKLESIVSKMEGGELSLEEALKHFEEGIALTRDCQNALKQAEQRVQVLMADEKLANDDDQ